jgi:hypothetical protein
MVQHWISKGPSCPGQCAIRYGKYCPYSEDRKRKGKSDNPFAKKDTCAGLIAHTLQPLKVGTLVRLQRGPKQCPLFANSALSGLFLFEDW